MELGPRSNQEDCLLVGKDLFQVNHLYHETELGQVPFFLCVCDGMGGHSHGEKASSFVCEQLQNAVEADMLDTANDIEHLLYTIQQDAQENLSGNCGTTVAGVLCQSGQMLVFNAGDSRIYAFTDESITRLSHDHSYVQEMIDTGVIDETEAFTHPYRNLVSFGIGPAFRDIWGKSQPHVEAYPLTRPVRLLICSDGVTDLFPDPELLGILTTGSDTPGKALLQALSGKGLKDNTSFILVEMIP